MPSRSDAKLRPNLSNVMARHLVRGSDLSHMFVKLNRREKPDRPNGPNAPDPHHTPFNVSVQDLRWAQNTDMWIKSQRCLSNTGHLKLTRFAAFEPRCLKRDVCGNSSSCWSGLG